MEEYPLALNRPLAPLTRATLKDRLRWQQLLLEVYYVWGVSNLTLHRHRWALIPHQHRLGPQWPHLDWNPSQGWRRPSAHHHTLPSTRKERDILRMIYRIRVSINQDMVMRLSQELFFVLSRRRTHMVTSLKIVWWGIQFDDWVDINSTLILLGYLFGATINFIFFRTWHTTTYKRCSTLYFTIDWS